VFAFGSKVFPTPRGPWHLSVMRTPVALPPIQVREQRQVRTASFHANSRIGSPFRHGGDALRKEASLGMPATGCFAKRRQAETDAHMSEWLSSPELQPPK
jgi:hypothetical protein